MEPLPSTTTKTFQEIMGELRVMADDLRVRAHLAGMNAKDEWDKLELELIRLEDQVLRTAPGHGAHLLADELRGGMKKLRARLLGDGSDVRASDLMTRHVATCSPDLALDRALKVMWERDCGIVPIVDAASHVVGVVTDRDAAMALLLRETLEWPPIADVMSKHVYSCRPDHLIEDVLEIMGGWQVHRLVVLEPDGKLAGMISLADVSSVADRLGSHMLRERVGHTLAAISAPRPPAA